MAVNQPTTEGISEETVYAMPYLAVSSRDYAASHRQRVRRFVGWALLLTLLSGGVLLLANGNIFAPLAVLAVFVLVWLMVQFPQSIMPMTLAGACLFELYKLDFADSLTDRVPLFWDFNTVVQLYGHQDFHLFPFSLFEVLFVLAAVSWVIRGIYDRSLKITWGSLALPILGYIACVAFGVAYGITTGGDYHMALFEARAQFYFFFAYLMAVNSGQAAQRQLRTMLWISALCIGFKALLFTFRFFVTLGGHTVPEIGVGSHEESFFFDAFIVLLGVLWLGGIEPKLQKVMLCLLPLVLIANLANERRAATAALIVAVPMVLGLAFIAFANRRKLILGMVIVIAALSMVYFPAYWNKDGVLAQPARALKSQFTPDARDQSSDTYRQAEDANLMFTMKTSPVIGYGYGKPIILYTYMVDLSSIDPFIMYITHDQILWVWMRVGTVGFFLFWVMISAALIQAAQMVRFKPPGTAVNSNAERARATAAVYVTTLIVMLLLFGLFDMQLSNERDMLFAGFWIGLLSVFRAEETALLKKPLPMIMPRSALVAPANTTLPAQVGAK